MRENTLRTLWKTDKAALNAWLTIPSAWTAEVMAHTGYDALTIDMQHGLMDYQTALAMLQAMSAAPVIPLVRVPWNEPAAIMRLLDAGAYGIICPMINNRAEAEAFVQACRYPPMGQRSYGPIRAAVYAGEDYFSAANQTVLTFAMIETSQALENVDEIAATPGLNAFYVGPVDLSISLGFSETVDLNHAPIADALRKIVEAAKKHGLATGIHIHSPENVPMLAKMGFQLLTVVSDTALMQGASRTALEQTRQSLGYS